MAKDIEINVKANTKGAQVAFDQIGDAVKKLNPELGKIAVTTEGKLSPAIQNFSKRDLSLFANQMLYSTNITGKLGMQLSNVATGLLTGGAVGAAFAGFAAIINAITTATNEWAKAQREAIAEVVKIETSAGSFAILEEKIPESIKRLNQRLATLRINQPRAVLGGAILELGSDEIKIIEETIAKLEEANKKYQTKKGVIESLRGLLPYQEQETKELEKQTKEIIKQVDAYKEMLMRIRELKDAFTTQQNIYRAGQVNESIGMPGSVGYRASRETQGMVGVPEKPIINLGDFESMQNDMMQFAQTSAGIFSMNMNQAWESIFGEANSMFEQMLSSWQSMLFEKIGFGIFNMLFGGIDLFGFARNLFGGQATAAKYRMGR